MLSITETYELSRNQWVGSPISSGAELETISGEYEPLFARGGLLFGRTVSMQKRYETFLADNASFGMSPQDICREMLGREIDMAARERRQRTFGRTALIGAILIPDQFPANIQNQGNPAAHYNLWIQTESNGQLNFSAAEEVLEELHERSPIYEAKCFKHQATQSVPAGSDFKWDHCHVFSDVLNIARLTA